MSEASRKGSAFILALKAAGILMLGLLALMVAFAIVPLSRPAPDFEMPALIGPVSLLDVETGAVLPARAIAVRGGRIERILPAAALGQTERKRMTDVGNAFVVPGLWDMHALLTRYAPSLEHPLYLAHGVTRVRNILDCPGDDVVNLHPCRADKTRWNRAIAAGDLIGPVIMGSGTYPVAGPDRLHRDAPAPFAAATPQQARELVRLFAARRPASDHIKTYDNLPRESFFALMDEARLRRVEVSGHVPVSVTVAEAAAAGFKAIAHARALPIGCSSREPEIMRLRSAGAPAARWMALALASHDARKCAALWATLKANRTFVSPTLITRYSETREGLTALAADPATAAATPGLLELIWQEDLSAIEGRSPEEEALYRDYYRAAASRTAEAARAGVSLLLGSDTNDVYVAPGIGLHREIELWRAAAIPAAAILRAGTINPAIYFGHERSFGRVAPGHAADLLFVDRNPLGDLSALRSPVAVMQAGRLYRRPALDAAIASAGRVAAGWGYTAHFLRDWLRNPMGFAN